MEASKVYYTDFRCPVGTSLLDKLRRVCIAAGIKDIDMDGKFVAIKMHFGELGNLAFLRPNYAKVVADLCKEQGGLPFLTDCNTLYPGSRKNALEHLTCAQLNGFWPMTTGCQVIIADGLRGTDEAEVPVPNGEYCKTAKIGRAIMDADIFISLTHFKGHEEAGFGGALKNTPAVDLGAIVIKEALNRAGVKPEQVDEVMFGCILTAAQGQNVVRQASIKAGIPYSVPAYTVGMVCGSGMKSMIEGARSILAGDADVVVCGGTENMSAAPFASFDERWGARMGDKKLVDTMIKDGLWDAFNNYHMGTTAENICDVWGITR